MAAAVRLALLCCAGLTRSASSNREAVPVNGGSQSGVALRRLRRHASTLRATHGEARRSSAAAIGGIGALGAAAVAAPALPKRRVIGGSSALEASTVSSSRSTEQAAFNPKVAWLPLALAGRRRAPASGVLERSNPRDLGPLQFGFGFLGSLGDIRGSRGWGVDNGGGRGGHNGNGRGPCEDDDEDARFRYWPAKWAGKLLNIGECRQAISSEYYTAEVAHTEPPFRVIVKQLYTLGNEDTELRALRKFNGGDVVTLFDSGKATTKHGESVTMLLMEAADTNLDRILRNYSQIRMDLKVRMMIQMLRAVVRLHEANHVHFDLDPSNILVFGDYHSIKGCSAKVSGLGRVVDLSKRPNGQVPDMKNVGSGYRAPETFLSGPECKSDVWSLGMIFHELLVGDQPLFMYEFYISDFQGDGADWAEQLQMRFDLEIDQEFVAFRDNYPTIGEIVYKMLRPFPEARCSAQAALRKLEAFAERTSIVIPEPKEVELPEVWFNGPS